MSKLRRIGLVLMVLLTCVGCDQAAKEIARRSLVDGSPVSLLNDSIRLQYTENRGAFLGLGSNLPSEVRYLVLVIFTGAMLLLLVGFALSARRLALAQWAGLSLMAGGGAGNLIDRLLNDGAVVDFVRLRAGPVQTGVFNLADVAIVVGVLLLLVGAVEDQDMTKPP